MAAQMGQIMPKKVKKVVVDENKKEEL